MGTVYFSQASLSIDDDRSGPSLERAPAGLRLRRRAEDEVGLGACVLAVSSSTLPSLVRTSAPETSLVINPEPARESSSANVPAQTTRGCELFRMDSAAGAEKVQKRCDWSRRVTVQQLKKLIGEQD